MMVEKPKLLLLLLMVLVSCVYADSRHLQRVRFRIVDEATGVPLQNRELNICRFVYFKLKPGSPSPYLRKDTRWYITSVTTDNDGGFSLALSSVGAMDIAVEPGEPYNYIRFRRASLDVPKSPDHIRVIRFEKGTTRVAANVIYDLKRRLVQTFPISGQSSEGPYTEVLLVAGKLKASAFTPDVPWFELSEGAKRVVPNLLERLKSQDPVVLFQLIDELVAVERQDDVGRTSLRYDLSSSDYSVILQRALPCLIDALSSSDSATSLRVRLNAGRALLELLDSEHAEEWTTRSLKFKLLATIEMIAKAHELVGVAPVLAPLLEDENPRIVRGVIRLLVQLRSGLAAPYLTPQLRSKETHEVYFAIRDLMRINATDAAGHIASALTASNTDVRCWALQALVQFDARRFKQRIFELVEQNREREDNFVRYAIAVLVKWDEPRAIPIAMKWLTSNNAYRRMELAEDLVELGGYQIVDSLIEFLCDPTIVGGDIGTNANIRRDAMSLLAKLDPIKAAPTLREYARGEHDFLAMAAAEELGKIRAAQAVPELLALLDRRDPSGGTWYYAMLALARIAEPNTIPRLLTELKRKRPGRSYPEALFALNVASDPDIYHKLHSIKLERAESLPLVESLAQLSEKCGIPMVLSEKVDAADRSREVSGLVSPTAIDVLDRIVNVLNYSGYKHAVFIIDGAVNVATIPEVYDFWEAWLISRQSGAR